MKIPERIADFRGIFFGFVEKYIVADEPSNCMGFAYWKLGLIAKEHFIDPGDLKGLLKDFDKVDFLEEAEAIAAIETDNEEHVRHIIVIDPEDRSFVVNRVGYAAPLKRVSLISMLSQFDKNTGLNRGGTIKVLYLKTKR